MTPLGVDMTAAANPAAQKPKGSEGDLDRNRDAWQREMERAQMAGWLANGLLRTGAASEVANTEHSAPFRTAHPEPWVALRPGLAAPESDLSEADADTSTRRSDVPHHENPPAAVARLQSSEKTLQQAHASALAGAALRPAYPGPSHAVLPERENPPEGWDARLVQAQAQIASLGAQLETYGAVVVTAELTDVELLNGGPSSASPQRESIDVSRMQTQVTQAAVLAAGVPQPTGLRPKADSHMVAVAPATPLSTTGATAATAAPAASVSAAPTAPTIGAPILAPRSSVEAMIGARLRTAPAALRQPAPNFAPPIRLHAEWCAQGVRLWLALDTSTLGLMQAITDQVRQWMKERGVHLLAMSCNGRLIAGEPEAGTEHEHSGASEAAPPQRKEKKSWPSIP